MLFLAGVIGVVRLVERVLGGEKAIVQAYLGVERMYLADPVYRALDLASVLGLSADRIGIPGALELHDLTGCVLHHLGALDDARVAQAHFAAGGEPEPALHRRLQEVVAFDVDLARERDLAAAPVRI